MGLFLLLLSVTIVTGIIQDNPCLYAQWKTQDFHLGGTGNGQVKKSDN